MATSVAARIAKSSGCTFSDSSVHVHKQLTARTEYFEIQSNSIHFSALTVTVGEKEKPLHGVRCTTVCVCVYCTFYRAHAQYTVHCNTVLYCIWIPLLKPNLR